MPQRSLAARAAHETLWCWVDELLGMRFPSHFKVSIDPQAPNFQPQGKMRRDPAGQRSTPARLSDIVADSVYF
jgi:hypothetical protein